MGNSGGPAQARRRARRAAARTIETAKTTRRLAARQALVASGDAPARPDLLSTFEMTQGSPALNHFYASAIAAGFTEMSSDRWPCEIDALEGGVNLSFRDGDRDHVYRMPDGTLAHLSIAYGMLRCAVAGSTPDAVEALCFSIRDAYPASYLVASDDTRVPITFWSDSAFGPVARLRKVESASWEAITGNYSAAVRDQLGSLMSWTEPSADGQLLLWQGPPGTGKTWGLRALASEWSQWAEFHYITDPDAFFVTNPSYMIDVLLSDSYMAIEQETGDVYDETDAGGKWRVLILEDTGELLSANAKEQYGQGLSRLLNVVDGMIGQGLRVLALVTTNDELGDLHPAVARPGRCASQIAFGPLSADEASTWLGEPASEGGTVAELYARSRGGEEAFADESPSEDANEKTGEGAGDDDSGGAANTGTCSCGDAASAHMGEMNDGACSIGTCDCKAFEAAATTASGGLRSTTPTVDFTTTIPSSGTFDYDVSTAVMTFVSPDGAEFKMSGNSGSGGTVVNFDLVEAPFAGATNPGDAGRASGAGDSAARAPAPGRASRRHGRRRHRDRRPRERGRRSRGI
jgi:hypothetical protein